MTTTTIKAGYKQTEIGVIPGDWDVESLGNCLLRNPEYGINAPAVKYSDNLPAYIRITDISEDGKFLPEKKTSVDQLGSENYFLEKDDIVFARTGASTGKTYLYNINDGKLVFAGFLIRVKPDKKVLSAKFLKSYTETSNYWKWISVMSMRSGQPGINGHEYASLQIPVPTKPEQKLIATTLSDTDELISSLDALISKKRRIKEGAMQELLTGKKRLAGFSGEWEVKKLGEIANVIGGGTPSSSVLKYWNGKINWFTPTEIGLNKYEYQSKRKITEEGLKNSSAKILNKGAILLTSRAGIGDIAILKINACTNQGFQSLVPKENINNEFLYYLISTKKRDLLEKASGSTFLEISPNNVRDISIQLPSTKEEQQAIAKILSDMDTEITVLEQKQDKYKLIKQGMMQQLLTGKIRLI